MLGLTLVPVFPEASLEGSDVVFLSPLLLPESIREPDETDERFAVDPTGALPPTEFVATFPIPPTPIPESR